ncbi:unnamed protein product [Acanthoscelides obtectus]|uniref:Uncharacterized protein n=1 Tax=Acanthoscelides obtectus TaxID=200917 RepID=A0A9P0K2Q9_ACAOB|nr:unnamed protein product [Acanthoscelides obtectus]CAK1640395.1 hypothetical protein AOBTE_LOCUS11697 [Acanthoscelides obtectus]
MLSLKKTLCHHMRPTVQSQTQELPVAETIGTNDGLQCLGPETRAPSASIELEKETSEILSSPVSVPATLETTIYKENQEPNARPSTSRGYSIFTGVCEAIIESKAQKTTNTKEKEKFCNFDRHSGERWACFTTT